MLSLTFDDRYSTMPWDRIQNVVFDVGNVLLRFDPKAIMDELVPDRTLHEFLLRCVFYSPYWCAMDHGTLTICQAEEAMIASHPELREAIHNIMVNWVEMKQTIPEGIRVLETCHDHGKRVFVLTNYGSDPFRVVQEKYRFFDLADGIVVSSRVGMIKPDPNIFRFLSSTYRCEPAATLFIDDSPVNTEAAMSLGWEAICYREPGQLDRFFY